MADNPSALILPAAALESLHVSFVDLTYTVREGVLAKGCKSVLRGASGEFRAGELSVIVGQSGAGKSSLMHLLAGYKRAESGRLLINGRDRDERFFRQRACYIMQKDVLQPLLTVSEALAVAAELKLGRHVSHTQKCKRVEEIIAALGLKESRDTRTGALSGGQRKRLAVGLELVSDPPIMFLDEPTSGLDSSTSRQMVRLLRLLARQGRTLVITMHQPSAPLLLMMDRLYAVTAGRCAFMGTVPNLVPYLKSLDLDCPTYHNPVDFLMEVCSGYLGPDKVDKVDELVVACQNGKCTKWLTTPLLSVKSEIENPIVDDIRLTALPLPQLKELPNKFMRPRRHATSYWKQFTTLFTRSFKLIWRDPSQTGTRLAIHCTIALLMGTVYYDIGNDAKYLRDNYSFLFFSLMFLMFTAFSGVTLSFPSEMPIIRREHFNRWYSSGAYFGASLAAAAPVQMACSVIYAAISYWMTGQPPDFVRFFFFTFMLTLISLIAMCIGLLNGTIFDVKNGVVFGPLMIMPFTVFSGFFLSYNHAPDYTKWIFHLSFLKHGLVGLCLSSFGSERKRMDCTDDFCPIIQPYEYLKYLKIEHEFYSIALLSLYAIWFVVVISAYLILRLRLKHKM